MKHIRIALFACGLAGLLIAGAVMMQAPEAAQALPPRPTPAPPSAANSDIPGGFILLSIDEDIHAAWTAVEWQDNDGDWHLVDGWRGSPDANSQVRWYVGHEHLGSGPFRWLLYDAPDGDLLATSETFTLPEYPRQTVEVEVSLP